MASDYAVMVGNITAHYFLCIGFLDTRVWFPRTLLQLIFERPTSEDAVMQEIAIDWLIERAGLETEHNGAWLRWQPDHEAVDRWKSFPQEQRQRARKAIGFAVTQLVHAEMRENDTSVLQYLVPHFLRLTEIALSEHDSNVFELCIMLGECLVRTQSTDLAHQYYDRALVIHNARSDTRGFDALRGLKRLGDLAEGLNDLVTARLHYEQALSIERRIFGDKLAPSVSETVCRIGEIAHAQGDTDDALKYFNQCIHALAAIPGHPAIGVSLNHIGDILLARGDLNGAQTSYERSLEIGKQLEGREGGAAALVFHKLGVVQLQRGDYTHARQLFERALSIRLDILETGDPKIIDTLSQLAHTAKLQGDIQAANQFLKQISVQQQ